MQVCCLFVSCVRGGVVSTWPGNQAINEENQINKFTNYRNYNLVNYFLISTIVSFNVFDTDMKLCMSECSSSVMMLKFSDISAFDSLKCFDGTSCENSVKVRCWCTDMVSFTVSSLLLFFVAPYWSCNIPINYDPSCPSVGRLVGWSVCHNFLKGWEVTLPCSYRSTCFAADA